MDTQRGRQRTDRSCAGANQRPRNAEGLDFANTRKDRSARSATAWPGICPFDVYEFSSRLAHVLGVDYRPDTCLGITPNYSGAPVSFAHHWQMYNLLRKYPGHKFGINTKQVATDEFHRCEQLCRTTNDLFSERGLNGPFAPILYRAKRKIAQVLGPVPTFDELDLRFGPGGVFGLRGNPNVLNKLQSKLQLTYALRQHVERLRETLPHMSWDEVELVHGSRLTFVPKDAKTDRAICIEPIINGLVQKGIGTYMKHRLRSFGVDLYDQQKNRALARAGSTGERKLATVDLKSASDTVSFGLVFQLLPIEWVELLDAVRSHRYIDDSGQWREFEKFSSMGCGFTFELESLIFWAIACSLCSPNDVSVYGDDIILPSNALELLLEVLTYCGFQVNPNKTFGSGSFRESCGGDYYFGWDVTPFRIKRAIRTVRDVYWLANALRSWADRWCSTSIEEAGLHDLYHWVISHVCRKHLFGPPGMGDGHLHVPFDVARPFCWRGGHTGKKRTPTVELVEGYWFDTYVEEALVTPIEHYPTSYVLYHAGPLDRAISDGVTQRGDIHKRRRRILGVGWPEIGSWF